MNITPVILTGLALGIMSVFMINRSDRNNNPLNIKKNGIKWKGLSANQSDRTFARFIKPVYGYRAAARILRTYNKQYGINTIEDIISRWAPPFIIKNGKRVKENDTPAYINFVSKKTGLSPNAVISENDYPKLLQAMATMEGGSVLDMDTIKAGINLA